jgi:exodeoxyribonuclease-5
MSTATANITLSEDQDNALKAIWLFLADPHQNTFVLSGFAGCGKSTLVSVLIDRLDEHYSTIKLLDPHYKPFELMLTATTNKAAESLSHITGQEVLTVHSALGLRIQKDFRTGEAELVIGKKSPLEHVLLLVDEASFIDHDLKRLIHQQTKGCKILFIGDPAQLAPVKCATTPVFEAGYHGAQLSQVVRQAKGNPIIDLATMFRHTVNTGEWGKFKPDGHYIIHMDRDTFNQEIEKEFVRPDWKYHDSKILAWTNKRVIQYNHWLMNLSTGSPDFQEGDYAVCNSFVSIGRQAIKTDQSVLITKITRDVENHGVPGTDFQLNGTITGFMPKSQELRKGALKYAQAAEDFDMLRDIQESWLDLRGAFAQTVNKSQGSTYDKVYIDLDDISACNNGDTVARMLYVGTSRARSNVFLTGDIA